LRERKRELQTPDIKEFWPENSQNIAASAVFLSRQKTGTDIIRLIKTLKENKSRILDRVDF